MIDLAKARELLKAAMETQGRDFIYSPAGQGCFYQPITELSAAYPRQDGSTNLTEDDPRRKTGCLIGVALDLHGETRHHGFNGRVRELFNTYPDMMTEQACRYFSRAQERQDAGYTWGSAFDKAEQSDPRFD